MHTFANILVATDYSPCADDALACVAQLARQIGAHLVILHVVPAQPPREDPSNLWSSGQDTAQKERDRLAQHTAGLLDAVGLTCEVEATWGSPAERIIDAARARKSDLIAIGSQGVSRRPERPLGSVADRVVRWAPCPVLTVRAADHLGAAPPPAARAAGEPAGGAPGRQALTVAGVIQQAPVTITQYESLAVAHALMVRHGIHQLPVVEDGVLIGILAERDLHAHIGYLERTKVDAAMTRGPVTVTPRDSAQEAARILIEQNINALPVVQADRLIGIVSRTDLLRLLLTLLEQQKT
jgi:CBS domain-containing protein/nucleotide-binding universal stress UspA family protein